MNAHLRVDSLIDAVENSPGLLDFHGCVSILRGRATERKTRDASHLRTPSTASLHAAPLPFRFPLWSVTRDPPLEKQVRDLSTADGLSSSLAGAENQRFSGCFAPRALLNRLPRGTIFETANCDFRMIVRLMWISIECRLMES